MPLGRMVPRPAVTRSEWDDWCVRTLAAVISEPRRSLEEGDSEYLRNNVFFALMIWSRRRLADWLKAGFDTTAWYCAAPSVKATPLGMGKAFRKGCNGADVDCRVLTAGTSEMIV